MSSQFGTQASKMDLWTTMQITTGIITGASTKKSPLQSRTPNSSKHSPLHTESKDRVFNIRTCTVSAKRKCLV